MVPNAIKWPWLWNNGNFTRFTQRMKYTASLWMRLLFLIFSEVLNIIPSLHLHKSDHVPHLLKDFQWLLTSFSIKANGIKMACKALQYASIPKPSHYYNLISTCGYFTVRPNWNGLLAAAPSMLPAQGLRYLLFPLLGPLFSLFLVVNILLRAL